MVPELVKRLIIGSMMYIFVQTHVKNCTQDTPYMPLRCILNEILPYRKVKQDHIGKQKIIHFY